MGNPESCLSVNATLSSDNRNPGYVFEGRSCSILLIRTGLCDLFVRECDHTLMATTVNATIAYKEGRAEMEKR